MELLAVRSPFDQRERVTRLGISGRSGHADALQSRDTGMPSFTRSPTKARWRSPLEDTSTGARLSLRVAGDLVASRVWCRVFFGCRGRAFPPVAAGAAERPMVRVGQDGRARAMFAGCLILGLGFVCRGSAVAPGPEALEDPGSRILIAATKFALRSPGSPAFEKSPRASIAEPARAGVVAGEISGRRCLGDSAKLFVCDGCFVGNGGGRRPSPVVARPGRKKDNAGDGRGGDGGA